ncbi:MAG: hypothetical protein RDU30_12335 [Desulfovibrionaceae bacterium]|nr:hypothetical protein [Desulfovibrionaceae bacterium]
MKYQISSDGIYILEHTPIGGGKHQVKLRLTLKNGETREESVEMDQDDLDDLLGLPYCDVKETETLLGRIMFEYF